MIQQFTPTHAAPAHGLPTYERPDPQLPPNAALDPGLEVQVIERLGQWAHVLCSNGWSAWVDGAYLVPTAAAPIAPAAPAPAAARPRIALTLAEAQANSAAAAAAQPRPAYPASPQYQAYAAPPVAPVAPAAPVAFAAPAAPAATAGAGQGLGPGVLVSLAGAAALGISSALPWISFSILGTTVSLSAFKLPAAFLWASTSQTLPSNAAASGLNLGMLLVAIAGAGAVLCFAPGLDFLRRGAGMAGLVVGSDFVRQVLAIISQPDAKPLQLTVFNLCGIGVWVGLAGALLLLLGTGRSRPATR